MPYLSEVMLGYRFSKHIPAGDNLSPFERLLQLFLELLVYTSGDVAEALSWMNELDKEYDLTTKDYGMGDFINDLKKNGYIEDDEKGPGGGFNITSKTERSIRQSSLEEIFGKLKKAGKGDHQTNFSGLGDEPNSEMRPYQFGDSLDQISMTDSLRNAQIQHGIGSFHITENDLEVQEREYKTQSSTVLMIDVSHSDGFVRTYHY